jgi:hypothetical protein
LLTYPPMSSKYSTDIKACVLETIILQETILQAQLPLRPPTRVGMKLTQFK